MIVLKQNSALTNLPESYTEQIQIALMSGQVIAYPTDTLYGLGVDAYSDTAVKKLYDLKTRKDSPVSVLLESVEQLLSHAADLNDNAQALIRTFLPGPLTVICKSNKPFAKRLISKRGTVGFRVPGDSISRQLPRLLGGPITTTSINPAGLPAATGLSEVKQYFGEQLALMIDVGPLENSKGSTVVDVTTEPFKILREGEISRQVLQEFLN
jgi:tRNA threonylcarbamoyl adenosine modification protein (Sua5/YciO/YrdC/YwlC family)